MASPFKQLCDCRMHATGASESTRGLHEFLWYPAAFVTRFVIVIRMWLTPWSRCNTLLFAAVCEGYGLRMSRIGWGLVLHLQPRDCNAVLTVQHHRIVSAWCLLLNYPPLSEMEHLKRLKYHLPVWWTDFVAIGCSIMMHLAPGKPFCSSSCPPRVCFSHVRSVLSLWNFFLWLQNWKINSLMQSAELRIKE